MALCATVSILISVLLWAPFVLMPNLKDAEPGSYGVIVLTWTLMAIALVGAGLIAGSLWPTMIAAPVTMAILVAAVGFLLWEVTDGPDHAISPMLLAVGVASSLLPQLVFGWLLGDSIRLRRVAHVLR